MIKVVRGYMYNPEEKSTLINEIYYEVSTGEKLSSKMDTLDFTEISEETMLKIENTSSKSYIEEFIIGEENSKKYLAEINEFGKPSKLYLKNL
ncbi:hypothetical protein [Bacillus sp. AR18-7]|uniref:hypothetical protein n=1 Tax=Bacillus sp. AR18-7 TaxID=2217821 RepID=UPI0011C784A2|nr:hypothetical protein [Bacillus sp. AR18-7]TXR64515.1 hypothetical protein DN395_11290 [Bacillus sp. AR18-7]